MSLPEMKIFAHSLPPYRAPAHHPLVMVKGINWLTAKLLALRGIHRGVAVKNN